MSKFKLTALISAICLMGAIFYGLVGFSQLTKSTVRLTTDPPLGQILPFEAEAATPLGSNQPQSPVRLTFLAVDASGHPLEKAKIHLQILTPSPNPLFPTDFPIVEGTELLDVEALAPQGQLQVQQILPIRGTYKLLVNVTPEVANAFPSLQQTLMLPVSENGLKYRYFGILLAILLLVGLGGGLIVGGKQRIQIGEFAPERVRLLLSGATIVALATLLAVNISAEISESHTHEHHHEHQSQTTDMAATRQSQGLEARVSGDVQATVGQPATLAIQVRDPKTGQPATDVVLKITATQLEDNWLDFAYLGVPNALGQFQWRQQFFDGAPHKVEVQVSPKLNAAHQFQPFRVAQEIEVEAVAPPLQVRLIGLAYFTGIIVLGLALGLWIRRRPFSDAFKHKSVH